jgi:hypothetical protein
VGWHDSPSRGGWWARISGSAGGSQGTIMHNTSDPAVMSLPISDKMVVLASLLRRANLLSSVVGFFAKGRPLLALLDRFRVCRPVAVGVVPVGLSIDIARILDALDFATGPARQ